MDLEKQIEQWIDQHQEELVRDIGRLVSHRSVSDSSAGDGTPYGQGCKEVLEEMLAMGREYGFDTQNHQDRCGSICMGTGEKTIGMWGHLDVVPEAGGWEYPPYDCTRVGDYLIGRGVQDNKGPSVAALYAMRCIKELGLPFQSRIRQVVGCNEERGMTDVEYYVSHCPVPDFSLVTDCGFPVCYAEKGILDAELLSPSLEGITALDGGTVANIVPDHCSVTLKAPAGTVLSQMPEWISASQKGEELQITARGLSKHAADPYTGLNAIGRLCSCLSGSGLLTGQTAEAMEFMELLCSDCDGKGLGIPFEDQESGRLTCVGSVVHLEQGRARLSFNIRYPVTARAEDLIEKIRRSAEEHGFQLAYANDSKPSYFDPASPLVQALTKVYHQVTGREDQPFVMGGGTYARKIPNAVAFGPGLPMDLSPLGLKPGHGDCHCPDEAQSIPNLLTALKIYVLSLLKLDEILSA